ncbi:MAG: spore maturation protein [Planctomycetes bacterium]|nr:spore maturation protein [Planctomycetota bacterium]
MIAFLDTLSQWMIPMTVLLIVVWAAVKGVPMYESFVTGAKEGFGVAVMIIPYLVAMLFVIKVFLASGIFADMKYGIGVAMEWAGLGTHTDSLDLMPLAFTRPLTGSGARAMLVELFQTHGPDGFLGNTATILMGSSETTFYILAIYYGSVQIKKIRHTLAACLLADLVGIVIALFIGYLVFGGR